MKLNVETLMNVIERVYNPWHRSLDFRKIIIKSVMTVYEGRNPLSSRVNPQKLTLLAYLTTYTLIGMFEKVYTNNL